MGKLTLCLPQLSQWVARGGQWLLLNTASNYTES